MSDLQCAATIILASDGDAAAVAAELTRRHVGGLWTSADATAQQTATVVGTTLGTPPRTDERLAAIGVDEEPHTAVTRFADAVWDISDLTRGETSVVITHPDILAAAVASRCRNVPADLTRSEPLDAGETAEIDVDSDGWVCTRWGRHAFAK